MNTAKLLCVLVISLFFFGCTNNIDENTNDLTLNEEILMLSDSTFFGNLIEIESSGNYLYMSDDSPRLFKLNQDLDLLKTVHTVGEGPGEFQWITDISYSNDSLYVYDHSLSKVVVYDNNSDFVREFILEAAGNTMSFAVSKNNIFLSTPFAEKPLTMFDLNGKIIKSFGIQSADTSSFNVYRNSRELLITKDKLIAVSESDPVVRIFNLQGELISTSKINHPLLEDRISYIEESYKTPDPQGAYSLALLFRDAVVSDGKLLLLAVTHTGNVAEYEYTLLLSYNLSEDGKLSQQQAYKLFRKDRMNQLRGNELAIAENGLIVFDDGLLLFEDVVN